MNSLRVYNQSVYVSYQWLIDKGIGKEAIKQWSKRNLLAKMRMGDTIYVPYDHIPDSTKSKLPSKDEILSSIEIQKTVSISEGYYNKMYSAYEKGFIKYLEYYQDMVGNDEKALRYAKLHAVWVVVMEIYDEFISVRKRPKLRELHEAFSKIYPEKYVYVRMCQAIKNIKESGIENNVIDHRGGRDEEYGPVLKKWVLDALSSGKAYSAQFIHDKVCELCREHGYKSPSLSWVKTYMYKVLPTVYPTRYGLDKGISQLPYAGIIRATNPGDQWQIDGWRLPFYMENYKTLTLFSVMDACSGRIVGYYIDFSENTKTILKGLENAVQTTNTLPLEILADNHSFNKTEESDYFKGKIEKMGSRWTISENPRYKSLIERSFGTFGTRFCKPMYGYIGEGIKTRRTNGRTAQELVDKYTKAGTFLTEEQIKLIAIHLVEEYNTKVGKTGQSPIETHQTLENNGIPIDEIGRLKLFVQPTPYTVRQGQINIEREKAVYEFQLNKEQYLTLNNKKVNVRYMDFDQIYLFDLKTDRLIGSVPKKRYAHGAYTNQTDEDIEILNKNKGRINGIKTAFKRQQAELARQAEAIDPEAAYAMNAKLTPKNIIEEFKENGMLAQEAARLGVNLDYVTNIPVFSEVQTYGKDEKKSRKRRESPMLATEKEIREFDINKYLNEDE
ncbi:MULTISPECIES: DDE-type integrase/transposase/recombinase [Bacteroidales]|nr:MULTISPECIES: DDE-type integrase/transposase/recombinase [Bacteroidales]RLT67504.1 transposase [Parabacteroides sp. CH2-D42-20]